MSGQTKEMVQSRSKRGINAYRLQGATRRAPRFRNNVDTYTSGRINSTYLLWPLVSTLARNKSVLVPFNKRPEPVLRACGLSDSMAARDQGGTWREMGEKNGARSAIYASGTFACLRRAMAMTCCEFSCSRSIKVDKRRTFFWNYN